MQNCFSFVWSQSSFEGQAVLIDHHNTRHLSQRSARDPGHCSRNKLVIILITRRMQPLTRPGCLSQERERGRVEVTRARTGGGDTRSLKQSAVINETLLPPSARNISPSASDYLHKMTGPFPALSSWLSQIFRFLFLSPSDCFWMTRHLMRTGGCWWQWTKLCVTPIRYRDADVRSHARDASVSR